MGTIAMNCVRRSLLRAARSRQHGLQIRYTTRLPAIGASRPAPSSNRIRCALYDASFGAGLLEALAQVSVDHESLLLVAYDTEYPEPINAKRPLQDAFGVAFVLTPGLHPTSLAQIVASLEQDAADTMQEAALESIRVSIPAARCLPLLQLLARGEAGRAVIDYLDVSRAVVQVEPCV